MNKKILRINYDFDFTLIGIITPARVYRLCWLLNRRLKMDLAREEDLLLKKAGEEELYFPKYYYYIEESETDFYLLANKGNEGFLIPEQKEIDFFMLIHNLPGGKEAGALTKEIRGIPEVQSAFLVEAAALRSKENLLF